MSFIQFTNLKVHVLQHTNEYPYPCDLCGKGFVCRTKMEVHKRVHTGERPYVCEVCDKSFIQRGTLTCHQRVHTGIKREATDTQQQQQNSAVAISFPAIKTEEEVSCISLYPFQTPCVVRSLLFCVIHVSVHTTHI